MKESKALKHRHERREPDNTNAFVFSGLLRATRRLRATAIMYALISRKTPSSGLRHVINAIFGIKENHFVEEVHQTCIYH